MTGLPALVLPCGFSAGPPALPIGAAALRPGVRRSHAASASATPTNRPTTWHRRRNRRSEAEPSVYRRGACLARHRINHEPRRRSALGASPASGFMALARWLAGRSAARRRPRRSRTAASLPRRRPPTSRTPAAGDLPRRGQLRRGRRARARRQGRVRRRPRPQGDFEVLEDGKPQKVAVFSLVNIPVERQPRPLFASKPIEPDVDDQPHRLRRPRST